MLKWYYHQFGSLILTVVLLVVTFTGLGFIVLSLLVNSNSNQRFSPEYPSFDRPEATLVLKGTPDPSAMLDFKDTGLGLSLEYPRSWQKIESGLDVVFSPTRSGHDPNSPSDTALWIGIPLENITNPTDLLTNLRESLSPGGRILSRDRINVGGQDWRVVQIKFESESLDGTIMARIATTQRNEVPYYVVEMAPTDRWHDIQPVFAQILSSLRFTEEAVLRPTDATPPPTPTPTPTPVIHIVQSGDSLLYIAAIYDVDIEVLAVRNGIDDPRLLQVGQRLIIPVKRR